MMRGHKLLHAIIKAILVYYPDLVFKYLRIRYPNWKIVSKYEVVRIFEEQPLQGSPKRIIDVAYLLKNKKTGFYHAIFHEVKSGRYDVFDVLNKYRGRYALLRWYNGKQENYKEFTLGGTAPLFIWAWSDEHIKNIEKFRDTSEDVATLKAFYYSHVRLIPIELLVPLIKAKMKEVNKILNEAYEKWTPQDYGAKIREVINQKKSEWDKKVKEILDWIEDNDLRIYRVSLDWYPLEEEHRYTVKHPATLVIAFDDGLSSVRITNVKEVELYRFKSMKIKRISTWGSSIFIEGENCRTIAIVRGVGMNVYLYIP